MTNELVAGTRTAVIMSERYGVTETSCAVWDQLIRLGFSQVYLWKNLNVHHPFMDENVNGSVVAL
jgi:hypothetical protein